LNPQETRFLVLKHVKNSSFEAFSAGF